MATVTADQTTAVHSKLEEFLSTMLQEIYWSEQNLVNVLTTMAQAATSEELKQSFEMHKTQTETHARRVEEVFAMLGLPADPEPSVGLQGLFDEGWQVIDETDENSAQRDAALIIAAQKVEHYEIACYGSMVTLAKTIGREDVAELLMETLAEEKETDAQLSLIAEGKVNIKASKEPAGSKKRTVK